MLGSVTILHAVWLTIGDMKNPPPNSYNESSLFFSGGPHPACRIIVGILLPIDEKLGTAEIGNYTFTNGFFLKLDLHMDIVWPFWPCMFVGSASSAVIMVSWLPIQLMMKNSSWQLAVHDKGTRHSFTNHHPAICQAETATGGDGLSFSSPGRCSYPATNLVISWVISWACDGT